MPAVGGVVIRLRYAGDAAVSTPDDAVTAAGVGDGVVHVVLAGDGENVGGGEGAGVDTANLHGIHRGREDAEGAEIVAVEGAIENLRGVSSVIVAAVDLGIGKVGDERRGRAGDESGGGGLQRGRCWASYDDIGRGDVDTRRAVEGPVACAEQERDRLVDFECGVAGFAGREAARVNRAASRGKCADGGVDLGAGIGLRIVGGIGHAVGGLHGQVREVAGVGRDVADGRRRGQVRTASAVGVDVSLVGGVVGILRRGDRRRAGEGLYTGDGLRVGEIHVVRVGPGASEKLRSLIGWNQRAANRADGSAGEIGDGPEFAAG